MIVHPPIYKAIQTILFETFNEQKYASKTIEKSFKQNKKWGARDRKIIAETVYDMVRWKSKITYTLKLSEAQTLIEEDIQKMMAFWFALKGHKNSLNPLTQQKMIHFKKKWNQISPSSPEFFHAIPSWIIKQATKELGTEKMNTIFSNMNEAAKIYLRVNELKTDKESLKQRLEEQNEIITHEIKEVPSALVLEKRANVFATPAFKDGWFEVQDGGSQQISNLFDWQPNMRVIDACAGAGGKSLHLASLMKNKGRIIALDVHKWKLQQLELRARRAGVSIIETRLIANSKTIKRLIGQAHALLLDVPCSGLGVLKRNPDTKWRLQQKDLQELYQLQKRILKSYSKMVKKNGQMIYATCSILPSENSEQVTDFLSNNPDWQLTKELKIDPKEFDGFYAAVLKKN